MYLAAQNPGKNTADRVHGGVGQDGEQSVNYLDKYSESVQWLTKLTGNKRRFYQQGIQAATVIRCSS